MKTVCRERKKLLSVGAHAVEVVLHDAAVRAGGVALVGVNIAAVRSERAV